MGHMGRMGQLDAVSPWYYWASHKVEGLVTGDGRVGSSPTPGTISCGRIGSYDDA